MAATASSPCAAGAGWAPGRSSSGSRSLWRVTQLAPRSPLAERLGYPPDARLVIVNCDDLGSSRSANVGVYDALRNGLGTSASLMVPCPWARDAAAQYRGEDVGVHLTLNAEWETYRWAPITNSPSLLDGDGGFPRTVEDTWDHADLEEVRRELRAQIERAILWGFDISHLDSHMGTLQLRADFFGVYLELAVTSGSRCGWARWEVSGSSDSRTGTSPPPKASSTRTTSCCIAVSAPVDTWNGPCSTCGPGSPRCTCTPRSMPTSCGHHIRTGPVGSRTMPSCARTRPCRTCWNAPAPR